MVFQYKWKEGAHMKVSAQTAGEVCEKLAEQNKLEASELVNVSRPKDAPLHNAFEWDDSKAGEEWRKHQARHIINCVTIVREEKEPIRAYFNVVRTDSTYEHINTIISNREKSQQLLINVLCELKAVTRKYSELSDALKPITDAIEQVENSCKENT